MIQLYSMIWVMVAFFAVIGVMRGWNKEIIGMAGIILAMFTLFQFDALLRGVLLASAPREHVFLVEIALFGAVVFFAYENRSIIAERDQAGPPRNKMQDAILGGMLGGFNGYLIWGVIWYLMDINDYPLSQIVTAPAPNTISAQNISTIPLVLMGGGPAGNGEFLTIAVIVLFLLVLLIL